MKYQALLLSLSTWACCCDKPTIAPQESQHCATDQPFASQLTDQTAEGKKALQEVMADAKYADPNPANAEVWCNQTWNEKVVGIYCGHLVDEYCKKYCSTGNLFTECTQEAARTKLTERCASNSIDAFRKAAPSCQSLAICGLRLKVDCKDK